MAVLNVNIAGDNSPLGLIVTVKGNKDGINFYSRFFAPELGVEEDPVITFQALFIFIFFIEH